MASTTTSASAVPAPVSARLIAAQTATTAPVWATEPPAAPAGSGGELTERERVVLIALGRGSTLREIAAREFVSYNTVKTHVRNIYRKLGIDDRGGARRAAHSLGLL